MTDLEICKRIAEINGVTVRDNGEELEWTRCPSSAIEPKGDEYNPLTDDGLCFQLMVKYKVSVFYEYGYAAIVSDDDGEYVGDANLYETPNKAICLAIIEANFNV